MIKKSIENKSQKARYVQILFELLFVILIILSPGANAAIPAQVDVSYATQVKPGSTLTIWVTTSNLNVENKSIYFDSIVFDEPFVTGKTAAISIQKTLYVNRTLAPVGILKPQIEAMKTEFLSPMNKIRTLEKTEQASLNEMNKIEIKEKQLKDNISKGVTTERIDITVPDDIMDMQTFTIPVSVMLSEPGLMGAVQIEKNITFSVTSNPVPKRAVIIIVDGARADKLYQVAQTNPDGNFSWMIDKGIKILNATNVFPSLTVVNHPAILTGMYPDKHGITSASVFNKETNDYTDYYNLISTFIFDRLNRELKVPTIYEKMPDTMTSRVFTEFVNRGADTYDISLGATLNWQACETLKKSIYCTAGDSKIIDNVIFPYFQDNRNFDLTVIWLSGTDFQSHAQGPDSTDDVLINADIQIGRLKEFYGQAIVDETIFLVTSDHGHTGVNSSRYVSPDQIATVLRANGYLRSLQGIYNQHDYYMGGNGGGSEEIYIQSGLDLNDSSPDSGSWTDSPRWEDIQPAASAFYSQDYVDTVLVRYQNSGGYRVYQENIDGTPYNISLADYFNGKTDYIDAINRINKLDSSLSGDIILLANYSGGYYFDSKGLSGDHGNLNPDDSYIPLIISGPAIRHDVLNSASIVDIAPTIANLLGFSMPDAEGIILPVKDENISLPSISDIYHLPSSPSGSDSVDIHANISDPEGISDALVMWSYDQSSGNVIQMASTGAAIYKTVSSIPAQSGGTTIYYKVCAEDTRGNNGCSQVYSYRTSKIIPFSGITGLIFLLIILSKLRKRC